MRRYKIEDKAGWGAGKPDLYVTLHKGPYTKQNILNKTGWLTKDCIITELKHYRNMKFDEDVINE
jgi:hypothetical protein